MGGIIKWALVAMYAAAAFVLYLDLTIWRP